MSLLRFLEILYHWKTIKYAFLKSVQDCRDHKRYCEAKKNYLGNLINNPYRRCL